MLKTSILLLLAKVSPCHRTPTASAAQQLIYSLHIIITSVILTDLSEWLFYLYNLHTEYFLLTVLSH